MQILRQFGELAPDLAERQRYAAWKVADIRKALREGRTPTPGNPNAADPAASTGESLLVNTKPQNPETLNPRLYRTPQEVPACQAPPPATPMMQILQLPPVSSCRTDPTSPQPPSCLPDPNCQTQPPKAPMQLTAHVPDMGP